MDRVTGKADVGSLVFRAILKKLRHFRVSILEI